MVNLLILKRSSQRYFFPTNIPLLEIINLILLKTILKPFLLCNEPNTNFFLISATCNILLKVRSFLEVIFNMTFPTSNTFEVEEFLVYRFSPSIFFLSEKHPLLGTYKFCSININPPLLRIVDKVDFESNKRQVHF